MHLLWKTTQKEIIFFNIPEQVFLSFIIASELQISINKIATLLHIFVIKEYFTACSSRKWIYFWIILDSFSAHYTTLLFVPLASELVKCSFRTESLNIMFDCTVQMVDQFGRKRYQKNCYVLGYKWCKGFFQKYFISNELQAFEYSFITKVWSRVDFF